MRGGVSSWADSFIRSFPQHEFVLWTIGAENRNRGNFKYELPDNVVDVKEIFLDDALELRATASRRTYFSEDELLESSKLISCEDPDWEVLFKCYNVERKNPVEFLMNEQFLIIMKAMCREKYPYAAFSDLFHTLRSMFLPLLYLMGQDPPNADIYHSTAAGYSGILGVIGKWKNQRPFILSEHGIYTREREEEILRAKWVLPYFKDMWIDLFYMLSRCAYKHANLVTSLFERAKNVQIELGCPPEKCLVINNGVRPEKFEKIPAKEDNEYIDIGAIVRIAPIKDIKTMIYSFAELKQRVANVRLHILGDTDDENYYDECIQLVQQLNVKDIIFVGNTDVSIYMRKLDFVILTSVSEGQPLSIIESMFADRPCVATDVGCCRDLIEGSENDNLGMAGICVPPMHRMALTEAMEKLCKNSSLRRKMGMVGHKRATCYFTHSEMIKKYQDLYERVRV